MPTKKAAPKASVKKQATKKAAVKKPVAKAAPKKAVAKKAAKATKAVLAPKAKPGGIALIRHYNFTVNQPYKLEAGAVKKSPVRKGPAALKVTLQLEPKEGTSLVYHPTPGFTSLEPLLAQLSVLAIVWNTGSQTIDLDKVELEYKKGNTTIKKDVFLPSDQLIIDPGFGWAWQNSRPYHENGDVVFLDTPLPTQVKLSFYFKNYSSTPVTSTQSLKPYTQGLALPFKAADFAKDEFVSGYSMHGGGDQVFAYDFGVRGYYKDAWSDLKAGKTDWAKNENYRIWGRPIYAMADGVVLQFDNKIPNNWKPDGTDAGLKKQKDELWGSFTYGGGGNHFYIRHGNLVALYAHMQKDSLNTKFTKNGATVKKGDFLGLAGNSGNSTGPHTHVHVKTYKNDAEPEGGFFRSLLFNNGYAIGQGNYAKPGSNVNWSKLQNQGVPGLKSKACFVHPSEVHPYCAYPTNWGEVAKHGVPESSYQTEFDKIWPCGYYPIWVDAYDVAGNTFFNAIFRPSAGVQWVARHNMDGTKYQTEFDTWTKQGYRLININSYLLKGKVRYAAVWIKDNSVGWFAYHGQPLDWHEANFAKNAKAGWVPANVSCVSVGGKIYVSALWEKKNTGGFYLRPVMSLKEFVDAFEQYTNKEKFKLVYLDGYTHGSSPKLSGIWYKNQPNYNTWWEKYHLSFNQYQTEYNNMLNSGFLTRCVAGYADGGVARFEGIWSK
ncbi:MAG TPA: peptidoglycan DD-metalloendopeptidase family protein [Phnomibacter sp.]|nr:peptidoglycan DD-metalloendopeptidase family protein [Phnomibacter sp.]